jgi:hypothetical protein
MKKISIVAFIVAAALTGCHKKPAATTPPASGSDMGSSMGSSTAPAGSDATPPAGGGSGSSM